ncbi:MAG: class I tRNA ligase family protein [Myxococcota bacterium]|nr:class I tRNA ligase family protein [Myxococcota bacterium]
MFQRPTFPKKAIVTGGMPYGNKELHFGHIGGIFIPADVFARFLRDRLGTENVIFVSGTDCYGSPIVVYHQRLIDEGKFEGSLEDFVQKNHNIQKETLKEYNVDINLFAASSLGRAAEIHREISHFFFQTLLENGHLIKRSTMQFFDPVEDTFLNGRQVVGRCPIQGCSSEKAYADECSLGHQYRPEDLIAPKSVLSGEQPILKPVVNWYLKLPEFRSALKDWIDRESQMPYARKFLLTTIQEFLEPPVIHVLTKFEEQLTLLRPQFAPHIFSEGQRKSYVLRFENLADCDAACALLAENGIRYRTGKTLVPFRLSGNIEWGIPVPEAEGVTDLSFWVWPESLWAPISFSATYLESIGKNKDAWKDWWCSKDTKVYQFIGEDNIYFYGLGEMGMFLGLQGEEYVSDPHDGELQLPSLVVNRHLLFLNTKASSSGKVKPPMARDLLRHYTSDQLRAHFISLGLGMKNISFRPKSFNPKAGEREPDPVLKEGKLLCNVFNRAVRSCFYTIQKYTDGRIPVGEVSADILQDSERTILQYERSMAGHVFHQAFNAADKYIRRMSKFWNRKMKEVSFEEEPEGFRQALIDSFHMLRIATVLMHPIAPDGCEKIRKQLNVDTSFWSWDYIFESIYTFMDDPNTHQPVFLEPRVDFFRPHDSQFRK